MKKYLLVLFLFFLTVNCNRSSSSDTDSSITSDYTAIKVYAGKYMTCVILDKGDLKCWGWNRNSCLLGRTTNDIESKRFYIGDDETPASISPINIGGEVIDVAIGDEHACALLKGGNVRCWGSGILGYKNKIPIGDDEHPVDAGDVNIGGKVTQITAGNENTCVLLDSGNVRCWGKDDIGSLGYPRDITENPSLTIGDDEYPSDAGDINIGGKVIQIATGSGHTCALIETGNVRCWGGILIGYNDSEKNAGTGWKYHPSESGDINVGGKVIQISAGNNSTCALLETGNVRCWGSPNLGGNLGYSNEEYIGDNEHPAEAGDISIGGKVTQISAGDNHTCVLLDTGNARCWGANSFGELGYGNQSEWVEGKYVDNNIGDNEHPADAGDINIGKKVTQISAGDSHTCVVLEDGKVKCWGHGRSGILGYGNMESIGDDEHPSDIGVVDVGN